MKNSLLVLLSFASMSSSASSTAGGHIAADATWSADTVLVTDTVWVDNGVTLTIIPGVYVEFQGHTKLNVNGRLLAEGSQTDSIVFTALDRDSGWHGIRFVHVAPENDSSKLAFCRLEYGSARGAYQDNNGGAVYIRGSSKIRISNCLIENNRTVLYGGGVYCDSASPVIAGNTIRNNTANTVVNTGRGGGGGICLAYASPVLIGNIITGNTCGQIHGKGGGVYWGPRSEPLIINNIISGNTAQWQGGGLYIDSSSGVLTGNLIAGNNGYYGGGVRLAGASVNVVNNTVCGNDARYGGGLSFSLSCSSAVANTLVWGNTGSSFSQVYLQTASVDPDFRYCLIQDGLAGFSGSGAGVEYTGLYANNLDTDPLFIDTAGGMYDLLPNSPCINAGAPDTAGLNLPALDLAGNPRIYGVRVDMGAYENQTVSDIEAARFPAGAPLLRNRPNPFNTLTTLLFPRLLAGARVTVYDVKGKRVLSDENVKGEGFRLDLSGLNSGLYMVSVVCGKNRYRKSVTLIK